MEKNMNENVIPIFYAVDNAYLPFLGVSLESIISNMSKDREYVIKILHTNITEENIKKIMKYESEKVSIEFVDLNYYINQVEDKLYTRDYYTNTTYFRLFIPNLYPQYRKAIYIDADTIVLGDIAELFDTELEDNLIGGVTDGVIATGKDFQEYVERVVGVRTWKNYFNAGMLLMNLDELRKYDFQEKFLYLLGTIKFKVAQDQDYLNRLCKGRVKMLDPHWNVMPINAASVTDESLIKIIHFNLADKPWHNDNVPFEKYFWEYANKSQFLDEIKNIKENYTEEKKFEDREMGKNLVLLAIKETNCVGDDRIK